MPCRNLWRRIKINTCHFNKTQGFLQAALKADTKSPLFMKPIISNCSIRKANYKISVKDQDKLNQITKNDWLLFCQSIKN